VMKGARATRWQNAASDGVSVIKVIALKAIHGFGGGRKGGVYAKIGQPTISR
jgi:hypothetical protein